MSPLGIASILAGRIVSMEDPVLAFKQLAWYMMTVMLGLFIHGFILLPGLYFLFVRANPFRCTTIQPCPSNLQCQRCGRPRLRDYHVRSHEQAPEGR